MSYTEEEKQTKLEANRIACAKWREKNREYEKLRSKKYYQDNQEKRLKSSREAYERNKEYYLQKSEEVRSNKILSLYRSTKSRSLKMGFDFDIELNDIIIPDVCPILGTSLYLTNKNPSVNTPSIDRVDNSKGYVKGNIQVISLEANRMKSNLTLEILDKIYQYMKTHMED